MNRFVWCLFEKFRGIETSVFARSTPTGAVDFPAFSNENQFPAFWHETGGFGLPKITVNRLFITIQYIIFGGDSLFG